MPRTKLSELAREKTEQPEVRTRQEESAEDRARVRRTELGEFSRNTGRSPLNERDILTVKNKKPGLVYRWFNDVEDRLKGATEAGWRFVTDKNVVVGDKHVQGTKDTVGTVISKNVGAGRQAYLMAIPEEWYEEYQEQKLELVNEREKTLLRKAEGQYGEVRTGSDEDVMLS